MPHEGDHNHGQSLKLLWGSFEVAGGLQQHTDEILWPDGLYAQAVLVTAVRNEPSVLCALVQ